MSSFSFQLQVTSSLGDAHSFVVDAQTLERAALSYKKSSIGSALGPGAWNQPESRASGSPVADRAMPGGCTNSSSKDEDMPSNSAPAEPLAVGAAAGQSDTTPVPSLSHMTSMANCPSCSRVLDLLSSRLPLSALSSSLPDALSREVRVIRGASQCTCGLAYAAHLTAEAATPEGYYNIRGRGELAGLADDDV